MARKPSQPALYELIRPSPQQRALPPATVPTRVVPLGSGGGVTVGRTGPSDAAHGGPATAASLSPAGPGRFVKVPVGYAYLAVAVGLAALVAVYIYGYSAGESAASKRFEERRIEELTSQGNLPAYDPLSAGKTPSSLRTPPAGGSGGGGQALGPQGGAGAGSGGAAVQDLGPPPGGDPRQVGLNYFVIAHTDGVRGPALVQFCRANGLDAHLVPDDNGRPRLVVVCPGFAAGERQSAEVKALEAKIRSVGNRWKSAARGNSDFGDLYPKKHKASP
jgi:hypothetical protein